MNEALLSGLFTLAGASLGIIYAHINNRRDKVFAKNEILAKQVASYWHLEKLYSEELAKHTGKSARAILLDYRDKVEALDHDRPFMTEKGAKRLI